MKLLDRYIAKTVLASICLVTLMLAGLQMFIIFVHELDEIGKAHYGIWQAAVFIFFQMPYQVYLFFPLASLLGSLVGLGIMANHHELVVMRAAGMSITQITSAVLKAAMVVILLVTVSGETIVPKLAYFANDQKMQALSNDQAIRTAKGVWLRYKNDFIAIGTIIPSNTLLDVFQFNFDKDFHLRLTRKIDRIEYKDKIWHAYGVAETIIENGHTKARNLAEMPWDVAVQPSILNMSSSEPDEMTIYQLHRFLRAQKKSQQTAVNYQLAYWQRLVQPLTTVVMMVLAIPFIFGPLRSSTMGSKLMVGATIGFGFHIINKFFGPISEVLQWPPAVAGIGPTAVFAMLGIYLMSKVK